MQQHCRHTHSRTHKPNHITPSCRQTRRCLHMQTDAHMGAGFKIKQRWITSIHPTCLRNFCTAESVPACTTPLPVYYYTTTTPLILLYLHLLLLLLQSMHCSIGAVQKRTVSEDGRPLYIQQFYVYRYLYYHQLSTHYEPFMATSTYE